MVYYPHAHPYFLMSLNESPTTIALLLCIISTVLIRAYVLLRRLQVSVDMRSLPSLSHGFLPQLYGQIPGFTPLVSPTSLAGGVLPRIPSLNLGIAWQWDEHETGMNLFSCSAELANLCSSAYSNHSHDVISFVPLLFGKPCIYTCSLDVMRQLLGNEIKVGLTKPQDMTMDP